MNREEGCITGERAARLMLCKWRARFETIERRAEKREPAPVRAAVTWEVKYGNGVNCECCNALYYRQFLLKIAACHTEGSLSVAAIWCGTSCVSALSRVYRVR